MRGVFGCGREAQFEAGDQNEKGEFATHAPTSGAPARAVERIEVEAMPIVG